jgi:hypothetical protein
MALADTARLLVEIKLNDKISRPLAGIGDKIDDLARKSSVRGGLSQIGAGIGVGIARGATVAAVGLGAIATQVAAGVRSLQELESVEAQTRAGIESTGGAAGITAEEIRKLAEKYEEIGGVLDDKVIQAAENVLLTFTNIREDAFEPTLEAALDLSTRMGTDLETAALQLGKALQDPVRGMQALTRVGVTFDETQREQIKRYVELGDIASAQQVILAEVNEEFGGSFAAAGTTNEATIGRFRDSVEGLQQNLATAFLPALDLVARRLNEVFSDPATIAAVKDFGDRLAGFITVENLDKAEDAVRGVFGYLAEIPWGAIGDGLRITGEAAKVAIDAFRSLPPGVQNALITLLAANKLTGGLVASGLGQLASVALGSLKTITAGHVTVVGGTVTGGPGGVPAGGAGGGLGSAGRLLAGLTGVGLAAVLAQEFEDEIVGLGPDLGEGWRDAVEDTIGVKIPTFSTDDLEWPFGPKNTPTILPEIFGGNGVLGGTGAKEPESLAKTEKWSALTAANTRDAIPWLERNKDEIRALNESEGRRFGDLGVRSKEQTDALHALNADEGTRAATATALAREQKQAVRDLNESEGRRFGTLFSKQDTAATLSRTGNALAQRTASATEATSRKNFSPVVKTNVNVNTTVKVSATIVKQQVDSVTQTTSVGGQTVL